ncbi:unnamed protein product [Lactuca virosa]|uniref:Uncharacterized protein n=1 Tax=Lactuca virosa TaxID=75947 RepID=A0AAU9LG68_9ASTR|nr:unnamed protein product [Lactuca virosa]
MASCRFVIPLMGINFDGSLPILRATRMAFQSDIATGVCSHPGFQKLGFVFMIFNFETSGISVQCYFVCISYHNFAMKDEVVTATHQMDSLLFLIW